MGNPGFLFMPRDWLASSSVRAMTREERSVYFDLLCHAWLDDGLPSDRGELARILGMTDEAFASVWFRVGRQFASDASGRLRNGRLESERAKQSEISKARALAGKRGGEASGASRREANASFCSSKPEANVEANGQHSPAPAPAPAPSDSSLRSEAPAPAARGKAKPPRKEPQGPQAEFVRHWLAEWARTRPDAGPYKMLTKDWALASKALTLAGGEMAEAKRRATALLDDPDEWLWPKVTLGFLVQRWNQLAVNPDNRPSVERAQTASVFAELRAEEQARGSGAALNGRQTEARGGGPRRLGNVL